MQKMNDTVAMQKKAFETAYENDSFERWSFHYTNDPLIRYLRDRRLKIGLAHLLSVMKISLNNIKDWEVLIICGGVGGEGTFFANSGFDSVTVSDFSKNSLELCNKFDPRLKTIQMNAEDLAIESKTYDLVVVQDGLHHLSRPTLGFTEMLRVAKKAVMVIEPHTGIIAKMIGTEWEKNVDGSFNYVFRWNKLFLKQCAKSYLLKAPSCYIKALRFWDHNKVIGKTVSIFPEKIRLSLAKFIYRFINLFFAKMGNMMVGIVIKYTDVEKDH